MLIDDPLSGAEMRQELGRVLTIKQVAWLLDVSTRSVRRLIASGDLRKLPLPRAVRISFEDLEAFKRRETACTDFVSDSP